MNPRIRVAKVDAAVYAGLQRMSERAESSALAAGLDPKLIELLKMRASQINGCAFCMDLHTKQALEAGETVARLAVLSAWRETEWFTEEEMAALELAEAVTEISKGTPSDENYERIVSVLGEEKYSAAFWVVNVINAFNRSAITSHVYVGPGRT
ncbi:MAG: carboxymuconolactone decarboxylase family protein [Solirubrobacterales bacterium]